MTDKWKPVIGERVIMVGHGLSTRRVYKVVGFAKKGQVAVEGRIGQPIIEFMGPDETGFLAKKTGDKSVCAFEFLWPYNWAKAVQEGRCKYELLGADWDPEEDAERELDRVWAY